MTKRANIDPVFALIEQRRNARIAWQQPLYDESTACFGTPEYQKAEKRSLKFLMAAEGAAEALGNVVPTTREGVHALLSYIEDVNLDRLISAEHRPSPTMGTDFHEWPEHEYQHPSRKKRNSFYIKEKWPFRVLRNIATALERIEASKNSKHHRRAA